MDKSRYSQNAVNWLLDLIFPIRCLECKKFGRYLCGTCFRTIPVKKTFECIGCKRPTPFGATCYFCAKTSSIDRLFIVADYKNPLVEKTLKFYKYRFITGLSVPLSQLAKNYLKWLSLKKEFNLFESNPLLISVPLHRQRLNWRGFNQSELLAKELADTFQMETANVLRRIKNKIPQADIKQRDARLANMAGAFECPDKTKLSGREVLLIDDVCTTGATLNECARVLKESGAGKVTALVIARG